MLHLFKPHSHDQAGAVDTVLESSATGIRALKISLVVLGVTTLVQMIFVAITGSVALLSDTIHNFGDALTAVPLWIAFTLARRPRNARYTHGYGRAEDLAGVFIVVAISFSAAIAAYESVHRLLEPRPLSNLPALFAASIVGFVGNEAVAIYRIRTGRAIGSAALVADGMHARTDGLTSLAVLLGAIGVGLGFERADAIAGLIITVAILGVLKGTAVTVYHRLMDAVSPDVTADVERVISGVTGVESVDEVRVRWMGHRLRAEVEITVDASLSVAEGHAIAVRAHHSLLHGVPRLREAIVHANPSARNGVDPHAEIAHHLRV